MRQEHNHEHRTRQSTNGSSQNGSSPHTNGSVRSAETNGFHTNGASFPDRSALFHGHDREEVTRILLQSLSDLGYHHAARQLSRESGYELEIPSVAAFRSAVQNGEWEEAEGLLFGSNEVPDEDGGVVIGNEEHRDTDRRAVSRNGHSGIYSKGLPLAAGANTTWLRFLIREQKYLELLEVRDLPTALLVLRNELTPLKRDVARLHVLSSLIMCQSAADLRTRAEWDGAAGESRNLLLSEISRFISPSVMIPEHRLATLLAKVQEDSILRCRYHNTDTQPSLYTDHECSADDFPSQTLTELRDHSDEVWCVEFSPDGKMLATAGKDGTVCVYDTMTWRLQHEIREHDPGLVAGNLNREVCYIAFSPDSQYLISCSQSNEFVVFSVRNGRRVAMADHFDYPVTSAAWLPDSQTFVIGSHALQRPLSLYSLRSTTSNSSGIVHNNEIHSWREPVTFSNTKENPSYFRVNDCTVSQDGTRLAVTTTDGRVLVYDLRTRDRISEWKLEDKLTSLCFSKTGDTLLLNMSEGRIIAMDSTTGEIIMQYEGIKQESFVIRHCFGGAGENFVVSGSEDSRVYIWRRQTGAQVACLDAHHPGTVNAVAWHPTNPFIFASAGDDRRVRIWASASHANAAANAGSVPNGTVAASTAVSTATRPYMSMSGIIEFSPP